LNGCVSQAGNEAQTAKEVFNMYAKDGALRAEDLGTALRSVGRRLTGEQVRSLFFTASPPFLPFSGRTRATRL
jgi:Ca2+-binding EF-hand superfamily protein